MTPAQLGIVTFRYRHPTSSVDKDASVDEAALSRQIVEGMIADGFAMMSSTVLKGRTALHLCTINPRTTVSDLEETIQRMEELGRRGLRR